MKKTKDLLVGLVMLGTLTSCGVFPSFTLEANEYETYFYIKDNVTIEKFSDYSPNLKDTLADSNIYKIEGKNPGPSVLIFGGSNPYEPSSQLAATLFLENIEVEAGTFYIITETFKSVYTHQKPEKAADYYYTINTKNSERQFKFGTKSNLENMGLSYPGKINGTTFEKTAYAVTELIKQNDIVMTIDLRDEVPTYMTNNCIVCHQEAYEIGALAMIEVDFEDVGIDSRIELAPYGIHGLSCRELGDYTDTLVIRNIVCSVAKAKTKGSEVEKLIFPGEDVRWDGDDYLYVEPISINEGVARHTLIICEILNAYNEEYSYGQYGSLGTFLDGKRLIQGTFKWNNIPSYSEIMENGVGYYLADQPEGYK